MAGKRRKAPPKPKTAKERMKQKIASELGLLERVQREGWGGLSAKECGQVGGLLSRALKQREVQEKALGNAGRA